MVNTKRSLVEPDRTPLQKQATTLIAFTFPPAPRSRGTSKRSIAAKSKSSPITPSSRQSSLQRDRGSPDSELARCTSPTLESSTAAAVGHSHEPLLPPDLPHLDSLDPLDLGDLLIDEDDDQLPDLHADMANSAAAAAPATAAAPAGGQDGCSMLTGAFLCQQLSEQLSGRAIPVLAGDEQPTQQQLQPDATPGRGATTRPAATTGSHVISSPVCDGTAYIVESATSMPGRSAAAATATSGSAAASGAATAAWSESLKPPSDVSESLMAVENWLDGMSVDAMLKEQGILEQQQQQQQKQPYMQTAVTEPIKGLSNTTAKLNLIKAPAGAEGAGVPGVGAPRQHQRYEQGYQQQYDQYVQQYLPTASAPAQQLPVNLQPEVLTPFTTAVAAAAGVPEGWQQQQQPLLQLDSAASMSMHVVDSYNSCNAPAGLLSPDQMQSAAPPTRLQQQQQIDDGGANSLLPMSFQALLMDPESATASAAVVTTDMQQHNQQMNTFYMPAQQQQQSEEVDSTPANNYRLLQQHQQQRRQHQQQLHMSQLHTVTSVPARIVRPSPAAAAGSLAGARSLPHSLQSLVPPAATGGDRSSSGVLAPAYSQPVPPVSRVNSNYPAPTTMHSSHRVMTTTAGIQYHTNAPPPGPVHTTSGHPMQMHAYSAPMHHQQPPQQQLSASQQELLALKQQLAEEKRRRKDKKKLRKMQKMLMEQQQQSQLQSQGSGMSQQVLLAAAQQQRPGSKYPPHRPSAIGGMEVHGQRSTTPQHGSIVPQHSWPQGPLAGSSGSNAARFGQAAASARHFSDSRDAAAASPHAAVAGFPLDSASAARQHAVAQSLRQLANKSTQQQQYRSAAGNTYPTTGIGSAANRRSPTPPLQGGVSSSNTRYTPYTPRHQSNLALTHSQSHPSHSHSLTPEPLGGTPGDSAVGPTLDGSRSVSLPDQVRMLTGTRGGQLEPSAPQAQSQAQAQAQAQARLPGTSGVQGSGQAVNSSNAGFSHSVNRACLPGVSVVLDLGDGNIEGQAGGARPEAVAKNSGCGPEADVDQRQRVAQRDTPQDGYANRAATAAAGAGGSNVMLTNQARPQQRSSSAVDMQMASLPGGTSPLSNSSSGRKRSFDQVMSLQQQLEVGSEHAACPPASPAVELQVMPYESHYSGTARDRFQPSNVNTTPAQQQPQQQQPQQCSDGSSQRQARLLQLPFTGADLADRREKEKERPQYTAQDSAAARSQQMTVAVDSDMTTPSRGNSPPVAAAARRYPSAAARRYPSAAAATEDDHSTRVKASDAVQSQQYSAPLHVSSAGWGDCTAMPDHSTVPPVQLPRSAMPPSKRSAVDMSMPPPPPHTAAAAGLASPVRGIGSSATDAAGCMSPASSGGYFANGFGGGSTAASSAVLGGGNIYRTSSGKVLRMVTHPVTGKPLLLGPAVDAKSSRLGNTSLGAPAPQLFGVEVQTAHNHHTGSGLGLGMGTLSGVSGSGSLGSPGSSTSRVRRQSSIGSKPRRRTSTAAAGTAAAGGVGVSGSNAMVMGPDTMIDLGLSMEASLSSHGAMFAGQAVNAAASSAMQHMPAIDGLDTGAGVSQGCESDRHGVTHRLQLQHAAASSAEGYADALGSASSLAPAAPGTEIAVDLMSYQGLLNAQGFVTSSNVCSNGVQVWGSGAWGVSSNAPRQAPTMYEGNGLVDTQMLE